MPSETWAAAGPAATTTARAAVSIRARRMGRLLRVRVGPPRLYPKVLVQLVHAGGQRRVRNEVDNAPVLDDVVTIGHGGCEVEVLLDEQDGEALALEALDRAADLLHDHRGQALGRLRSEEHTSELQSPMYLV